jgi:hypothetical protein
MAARLLGFLFRASSCGATPKLKFRTQGRGAVGSNREFK